MLQVETVLNLGNVFICWPFMSEIKGLKGIQQLQVLWY